MPDKKIYFPLFVDLNEKQILIFGGGQVATRRLMSLLDFGGLIKVVAPEYTDKISKLAARQLIVLEKRSYREGEICMPYMVLAATSDSHINQRISMECRQKGIFVNTASDQTKSDFFFPGLVVEEPIVIGVTASGKDHKKAKRMTEQIKAMLKDGSKYEEITDREQGK